MIFDLTTSIKVLAKTPKVLTTLLDQLPDSWTNENEGPETWSAYDIIGHLIHGEKTDWIPRLKIILSSNESKEFETFDRFAQFQNSKDKTLNDLLIEFSLWREKNLKSLKSFNLQDIQYNLKGIHPEFGEVSLKQLLATWVVHDLNHINQLSRVLAKVYKSEVGPWNKYISVLNK